MDVLHDKWYKVVPCGKRSFAVTEVRKSADRVDALYCFTLKNMKKCGYTCPVVHNPGYYTY